MPRTSGYKNRGLNNPNSYRNRNKSSETSNKGAETINKNSNVNQQTTSTPNVTDSGFRGDNSCLLYTSPSPRDATLSRMPSSA